jgi:hypothetical protein
MNLALARLPPSPKGLKEKNKKKCKKSSLFAVLATAGCRFLIKEIIINSLWWRVEAWCWWYGKWARAVDRGDASHNKQNSLY